MLKQRQPTCLSSLACSNLQSMSIGSRLPEGSMFVRLKEEEGVASLKEREERCETSANVARAPFWERWPPKN